MIRCFKFIVYPQNKGNLNSFYQTLKYSQMGIKYIKTNLIKTEDKNVKTNSETNIQSLNINQMSGIKQEEEIKNNNINETQSLEPVLKGISKRTYIKSGKFANKNKKKLIESEEFIKSRDKGIIEKLNIQNDKIKLSDEQNNILLEVEKGSNIFITGI
jgi:hypothetical protein